MKKTDLDRHPCFNPAVKGQFGRVHLPVAPRCNIKCNYCNRKYDCVNESRPGVTSSVLAPDQALMYMKKVLEKEPRITVAGIAGPGDPFANPEETMATLRLIRARFPDMILCLASNGLAIGPYIDELADLDLSHVTITVNGVDPEITQHIYGFVRDGNLHFYGIQAAELLLSRQKEAIVRLKARGITVKVNTIVIPGINDTCIEEIARTMQAMGVDLLNCMALFPNVDTPFADIAQPDKKTMAHIRNAAERYLPQMRHCTRCRADAVGLLHDDRTEEFRSCLTACATVQPAEKPHRSFVAVATMEGVLVNQHLGEAEKFQIWQQNAEQEFVLVEERPAPRAVGGVRRWLAMAAMLKDCRAVLVSAVGTTPRDILQKTGISVMEAGGFIRTALEAVYSGQNSAVLKKRRTACDAGGCKGAGGGCLLLISTL